MILTCNWARSVRKSKFIIILTFLASTSAIGFNQLSNSLLIGDTVGKFQNFDLTSQTLKRLDFNNIGLGILTIKCDKENLVITDCKNNLRKLNLASDSSQFESFEDNKYLGRVPRYNGKMIRMSPKSFKDGSFK